MNTINIGIIGDGLTDYRVFGKIAESILLEEMSQNIDVNIIPLVRHKINDHVQKYKQKSAKNNQEYYLPSKTAEQLRDQVCGTIINAFRSFENEIGGTSYNDLLLITTDTEHTLKDKNMYFSTWAVALSHILREAIEKFYEYQVNRGYSRKYLPIIMSLATFPSTEVLVAAARGLLDKNYGKKPKEWKLLLYTTEHPQDEEIEKYALNYITPDNIDIIFKDLPESRVFIQTLSLGIKRCLLNGKANCEI